MGMPDPNAPECDCGHLERYSKEPYVPIAFDPKLNEYYIQHGAGGQIMVYHCPFCGGRTPKSRRDEMFMHVTDAEIDRMCTMTRNLSTLPAVLAQLGVPDSDDPASSRETKPDELGRRVTTTYRTLTYKGLSPTADVKITVHADERVQFSFMPKAITDA